MWCGVQSACHVGQVLLIDSDIMPRNLVPLWFEHNGTYELTVSEILFSLLSRLGFYELTLTEI